MENRGLIARRGFGALALLWLLWGGRAGGDGLRGGGRALRRTRAVADNGADDGGVPGAGRFVRPAAGARVPTGLARPVTGRAQAGGHGLGGVTVGASLMAGRFGPVVIAIYGVVILAYRRGWSGGGSRTGGVKSGRRRAGCAARRAALSVIWRPQWN